MHGVEDDIDTIFCVGYHAKVGHSDGVANETMIGREMIECLLKADANSNAREVEHANQRHIRYVAVDDANVVANVNTLEEYARLQVQTETT